MAIKKVQANFDNGTSYDVLHYETQVSQVKLVDASGNTTSDLNETLFAGKSLSAVDVNTLKTNGKSRVTNAVNLPAGVDKTKTYILNVDAVDVGSGVIVVHQELYDHINHETYHRTINGTTVGTWVKIGKALADQVAKIGDLATLNTTAKDSLVKAINELDAEVEGVKGGDLTAIQGSINALDTKLSNHNHDSVYLKLSGGALTNTVSVANDKSFAGKNTSGVNLNIGKVNGTNDVVLGDIGAKTILQAKNGEHLIHDGANAYTVFHSGNHGSGSGLNADMVDGIEGATFARRDATNYFKQSQVIDDGKHFYLESPDGSEQAGSIVWRNSEGVQKGKVAVSVDGNLSIFAGGINGHTFKSDGELFSNYDHIFDAQSREVRIAMRKGSADKGIGFYMNPNDNSFKLGDWNLAQSLMTVYRDTGEINFAKNIKIQGHRLFIQSGTPANPSVGDVWIDI